MTQSETASLVIRVQANEAGPAKQKLDALAASAGKAETATGRLAASAKGLGGPIAGLVASFVSISTVIAAFTKLVNTGRQFEVLKAGLVTATGSAENAAIAFDALVSFAQKTPYDLAQTVEAFTQLTNRGLIPSERALYAFGNTASATGHRLDEMVLAVANATNGEYETLKRFGVNARTVSDGIEFTFRGITTKVGQSTKAIEDYFIHLGESNFGNAMQKRMETLDGAISNLGDAWDRMFNAISEAGVGDIIKSTVVAATEAIDGLRASIESGQILHYIDAVRLSFAGWGDAAASGANSVITEFMRATDAIKKDTGFDLGAWIKTKWFGQMPENFKYLIDLFGTTVGTLEQYWTAGTRFMWRSIFAVFEAIVSESKIVGKTLYESLFSFRKAYETGTAGTTAVFTKFNTQIGNASDLVKNQLSSATKAWNEQVDAIDLARKKTIEYAQAAKDAGDESFNLPILKPKEDRLAQFVQGNPNKARASAEQQSQFIALKKSLLVEEDAIKESYERRLALIRVNTEEGSAIRAELEANLETKVTEEYENAFKARQEKVISLENELNQAISEGRFSLVDDLRAQLERENEETRKAYAIRKAQILADTETTQTEKNALVAKLDAKYVAQTAESQARSHKLQLSQTADFFGNLATVANAFGSKGARIAKAAAIVQATIKTYESATSAYASLAGIPYIGPALGAAAAAAAIAAGVANVAAIKSQNYSGAYDSGGMIPSGKFGIVGENGAELVSGPAVVTSRRRTAELAGDGGATGGPSRITINNFTDAKVEVRETETDQGKLIEFMIKKAESKIASNVRDGKGPLNTALTSSFGLSRGAAA